MIESNTLPGLHFFELTSSQTNKTYWIGVGLPDGYDKGQSYPAIYVTDAEGKIHTLLEMARALAKASDLEMVIIIGITNASELSREEDFTPSQVNTDLTSLAGSSDYRGTPVGGARQFHRFLTNELMPHINTKFKTDKNKTVYFGHSLGGLFGLYELQQSDTPFTSFLISSPSIWWNDRERLQTKMPKRADPRTVYLSVGEFEQIPPNLDAKILALFPEKIVKADRAARMVEGMLDVFDYLSQDPGTRVFAHIEESAPHIGADIPAFSRGMRVILEGTSQSEMRRRSAVRPDIPWQ